ncbi:MAG TPA: lipopolysaccharide biosynthesis protein [Thermoleophilaceae bacterium]|jgi:O-antigen/teichoic acid export membrane protein
MGSSLLRNAVYIMLTTGVTSGLGYVFWLVVARTYEADEVGIASALIAAMSVVASIADLGTSRALVQRLPSRRTPEDWSRTLTASVLTAVVAGLAIGAIAALAIVPALSDDLTVVNADAAHALLFVAGVVLWSVSIIADFLFIAERRSEHMFTRNLVFGVAKLLVVVALVVAGDDSATGVFVAWIAGCALSIVVVYGMLMPRLETRYRPALAGIGREVRAMAGAFAGNYFITLGYLLTTFLLPLIVVARLTPADTAYFYVAWLLGGAFFTVTSSVGSALFAEGAHDPEALDHQTRSAVRISAALVVPLMIVFFAAADPILRVFGAEYADNGKALLLLLTASAIPDAITGLYIARERAIGRLGFPSVASMGMAILTLTGAWLLLPSMDLAGAGVAFVGAQLLGCAGCLADALHRSRISARLAR